VQRCHAQRQSTRLTNIRRSIATGSPYQEKNHFHWEDEAAGIDREIAAFLGR
jgi:hypothetical protein